MAAFTGTGTSEPVAGMHFRLGLNFSGTASVDLEEMTPDGTAWVKVGESITSDYSNGYDYPVMTTLRWNCTAHTNDVQYWMEKA